MRLKTLLCALFIFSMMRGQAQSPASSQTDQQQLQPPQALQNQELTNEVIKNQELEKKLRQLELQTRELTDRIAALEKSQPSSAPRLVKAVTPAAVPATSPEPANDAVKNGNMSEPTGGSLHENHNGEIAVSTKTTNTPASQTAPDTAEPKFQLDIYGFAMLDMGYEVNQQDPNWFDVVRPTKLPAFPNEFGHDGRFYSGVRQSRFGVKGYFQTPLGELKTILEYELFGVGVDAGQTTFRLRHAWGELNHFGAGQSWSPFMDPDVFPNSLEYWGPNGMVFFRNVQFRWMPINKGNHQLWFALERPGASADPGSLAGRDVIANTQGRFPAPDISGRFRWGGERGYLQLAGIFRYIAWDDLAPTATTDISNNKWGWGWNLSSNVPVGKKDLVKWSVMYGNGVENYMNDAPVDVAPIVNPGDPRKPIDGKPLPVFGVVGFLDHYWNDRWSSSIGYSMLQIQNVALQTPDSFHRGQYGLVNLLYYPVKNVMLGGEFQWGRRENFTDGFVANDYRTQFSARYNFDFKLGGPK
jgi:hypothetical protein